MIEPLYPTDTPQTMHRVPFPERPRERLLEHGAAALSDAELVAVLLRTGGPGRNALAMARDLLADHGGLLGLVGADPDDLMGDGLGPAKASTVLAAVELGRRFARRELPDRELHAQPAAVARYLGLRYGQRGQEVVGALYLDIRNRLIGEREIFRGTLNRSAAEPREILKEALILGAAGVVVFHTHPSGDPTPSFEDLAFTRRVAEAGEMVGVELLDHMILGGGGAEWVSLRERGAW
jgi:DNA repair protein RadC